MIISAEYTKRTLILEIMYNFERQTLINAYNITRLLLIWINV